MRFASWLAFLVVAAFVAYFLTGEWLAGASLFVVAVIWFLPPRRYGVPILQVALTSQWSYVTSGLFYFGFTGRTSLTRQTSCYQLAVLLGLLWILILTAGIWLGSRLRTWNSKGKLPTGGNRFTLSQLLVIYVLFLVVQPLMKAFRFQYGSVYQIIDAIHCGRYAIVYLILRNLAVPRFRAGPFLGFLAFEIALGFTDFFAAFREPLVLAFMVFLEVFNPRKMRHWILFGIGASFVTTFALLWTGIKDRYRREMRAGEVTESRLDRLDRVLDLTEEFLEGKSPTYGRTLDTTVERMWQVYYPSLALERVPQIVPHEEGRLIEAALAHILLPRIFFPDKQVPDTHSEYVRKYCGRWVSGLEADVSIAFGCMPESYVDFGIPLMFLPILIYGLVMGLAYEHLFLMIRSQDLAVGVVVAIFWLSLYNFEASWLKMLGRAGMLLICLGAIGYLLDRIGQSGEIKAPKVTA